MKNLLLTLLFIFNFVLSQSQYEGCTDMSACNYNQNAIIEDGSCFFPDENPAYDTENPEDCSFAYGCGDDLAINYNPYALIPTDDDCQYVCKENTFALGNGEITSGYIINNDGYIDYFGTFSLDQYWMNPLPVDLETYSNVSKVFTSNLCDGTVHAVFLDENNSVINSGEVPSIFGSTYLPPLQNVREIGISYLGWIALLEDGSLTSQFFSEDMGIGSPEVPYYMDDHIVIDISVDSEMAVAVTSQHELFAWGYTNGLQYQINNQNFDGNIIKSDLSNGYMSIMTDLGEVRCWNWEGSAENFQQYENITWKKFMMAGNIFAGITMEGDFIIDYLYVNPNYPQYYNVDALTPPIDFGQIIDFDINGCNQVMVTNSERLFWINQTFNFEDDSYDYMSSFNIYHPNGDVMNSNASSIMMNLNGVIQNPNEAYQSSNILICENLNLEGCTDDTGVNYNPDATIDDGSCLYCAYDNPDLCDQNGDGFCDNPWDMNCVDSTTQFGCLDPYASNYCGLCTQDDYSSSPNGTCEYSCDLVITSSISGDACSGGNSDIVVAVEGGSGNYSYQWSNGVVGSSNLNLSEGIFSLAVFDLNTLCTAFETFEINSIENSMELDATIDYNLGFCATATIDIVGGTPPYTYESAGALQSSNVIEDICSGEQLIIVTDANGCTQSINISIMSSPDWNVVSTDINHIILIPSDANLTFENSPLTPGSYIGVFYTNQYNELVCGGSVLWEGVTTSIPAWGTEAGEDNGFSIGEAFIWGMWDVNTGEVQYGNAEYVFNPVSFTAQGNFNPNGMSSVASITTPAPTWNYDITSGNHTIALSYLDPYIDGEPIENGDWFGVFYEDDNGNLTCGGMRMWTGENEAMTAWIDDSTTDEKDGFSLDEDFTWKIWDYSTGEEFFTNAIYVAVMPNQGEFAVNGLSAVESFSTNLNQSIVISDGWSIISTYIDPEDPNMVSVFSSITDDGNLVIVKDQSGYVYWPEFNLNNIGDITIGQGYQIKANSNDEIVISGMLSQHASSIPLSGWSILGYLHREPADAVYLMSPQVDYITIVKDEDGNVYWPEFNLNSIGDMQPGKGYQIKTSNDITFQYPDLESGRFGYGDHYDFVSMKYEKPTNTGNNMSIAIPSDVWQSKPSIDDEIVVRDMEGLIVGNALYREGGTVVTIWGDDELTEEKDGLHIGEELNINLLRLNDNIEEEIDILSWKEGSGYYSINGISIAGSMTQNIVREKELIKITDVLGREVKKDIKGSLLYIYDDGSMEKKYILK